MYKRLFYLLLVLGLLLAVTTLPAFAGKKFSIPPIKIEKDWIGWAASNTESKGASAVSALNSSQQTTLLPYGGTGWAQAYLGWAPLRMDAVARTGVDSAAKSFHGASRVVQVYKNGAPVGHSGRVDKDLSWPSDSVSAQTSVYGYVGGNTWRNDTSHLLTDYLWFSWGPSNSISVTL